MISLDPERPIQNEAEFRKQCEQLGISPEDDPVYLEVYDLAYQITHDQDIRGRSINLSGAYGTGKTSFVNILSEQLKKDHIVINARTMFYGNFDEYIEGVLSDLYYEVRDRHGVKLPELIKLSRNVTVSVEGGLNLGLVNVKSQIARTLNLVRPKSNDLLLKENSKLNRKLASIFPKRIIIILDDIDRLKADELLTALRFIEVLKQLDNVFVIAIGDVNQIGGILGALQLPKPYEFARKVFDHRLYLERSLRDREQIVQLMVNRLMGEKALTDKQKEIVSEAFYFLIMTQIIQNIRSVVRDKFATYPSLSGKEFNDWWDNTLRAGNDDKLGPIYNELKAFYRTNHLHFHPQYKEDHVDWHHDIWLVAGDRILPGDSNSDALAMLNHEEPPKYPVYEIDKSLRRALNAEYWATTIMPTPFDDDKVPKYYGLGGAAYKNLEEFQEKLDKSSREEGLPNIIGENEPESRWSIAHKFMKDPTRREMEIDQSLPQLSDLRILKAFALELLEWLPEIEGANNEAERLVIYATLAREIDTILEKEKRSV